MNDRMDMEVFFLDNMQRRNNQYVFRERCDPEGNVQEHSRNG